MNGFADRALGLLRRLLGGPDGAPAPLAGLPAALDGHVAVALTEACLTEVAGLGGRWPATESDAAFLRQVAREGVNLLGRSVSGVEAEGPRGALATSIGLALSGLRSATFLSGPDLAATHDLLDQAVGLHAPLVIHLSTSAPTTHGVARGGGHAAYHAAADAGAVLLFAQSVQEAVDLTLVAHRVAETALVPVIVAMDAGETGRSIQDVELPTAEFARLYLGDAADQVDCPTPAQALVFGPTRRRVPRAYDLERPSQRGGVWGPEAWGLAAAGHRAFFAAHVPELLRSALDDLGVRTGRAYPRLSSHGVERASVLLVAQGAAVEVAEAAARHLGGQSPSLAVGVVGLRCLRPLDSGGLAKLLGDRRVIVLERVDAPLSGEGPLLRLLRACVQRGGGRAQLRWALYGLGRPGPGVSDLIGLCEAGDPPGDEPVYLGLSFAPGSSAFPKRQVLLDELARQYPALPALGCQGVTPAPDLRGEGAITVAVHALPGGERVAESLAAEAGALLHDLCGGRLRGGWLGASALLSWSPGDAAAGGLVPGAASPIDLALLAGDRLAGDPIAVPGQTRAAALIVEAGLEVPAGSAPVQVVGPAEKGPVELRRERLLGALIGRLCASGVLGDLKARKVLAAREAQLTPGADQSERLGAFRMGYQSGLAFEPDQAGEPDQASAPSGQPPRAADPGQAGVPLAVRHLQGEGTADSLPRFWDQVGVLYRDGRVDELCPDPHLAAGVVPPLSSTFSDWSSTRASLPVFDPKACTGCGGCWTACPDAALGAIVISASRLLEAGMEQGAAAGADTAPLRMLLSKLGPRVNRLLAEGDVTTAGEVLPEAFEGLLGRMTLTEDRKAALQAAFQATLEPIGDLPIARTAPFFDDAEGDAPGSGELLTLAIDPDACKGCGLCSAACEPAAITLQPQTASRLAEARAGWRRLEILPDTLGQTIAAAEAHPDVGAMAAVLLSRHAQLALVGGDGAEAGSGARLALRLVLAAAEPGLQARLSGLIGRVESLRERLDGAIGDVMGAGLPDAPDRLEALAAGLDGLARSDVALAELVERVEQGAGGRIDAERLGRLVQIARQLADLSGRLSEGPHGLGRARLGVVLADSPALAWAATFPHNPFQAPVVVAGAGEAARLGRGLLEGQLRAALEGVGQLRRAALELEQPAQAPLRSAALGRLSLHDLDAEARGALPPLLLVIDDAALGDRELAQVMALLSTPLPFKVLVLADPGRRMRFGASGDRAGADLGLLALMHRGAFVAQISPAWPDHLAAAVRDAMAFDGPALLVAHAPSPARDGYPSDQTLALARLAVERRAFPLFRYDPRAEGVFGLRISLAGNPELAGDGDRTSSEWARSQGRFAEHFEGDQVGELVRGAAEADAARWRTLQELAGVVSPFVERARGDAERAVAADREAEISALRAALEAQLADARSETEVELAARVRERLLRLAGYAPEARP